MGDDSARVPMEPLPDNACDEVGFSLAALIGDTPKHIYMARTAEGKYLRGHFAMGDFWILGFLSEWGCRKHSDSIYKRRPTSGPYNPVRLEFDEAMDIVRSIARRHDVSGLRVFDSDGNLAAEYWVTAAPGAEAAVPPADWRLWD